MPWTKHDMTKKGAKKRPFKAAQMANAAVIGCGVTIGVVSPSGTGFIQLVLEPGWRLMRRQYGKRTLGHLYVYRDTPQETQAP